MLQNSYYKAKQAPPSRRAYTSFSFAVRITAILCKEMNFNSCSAMLIFSPFRHGFFSNLILKQPFPKPPAGLHATLPLLLPCLRKEHFSGIELSLQLSAFFNVHSLSKCCLLEASFRQIRAG